MPNDYKEIKSYGRCIRPGVFCQKAALKNFAKFTGKHGQLRNLNRYLPTINIQKLYLGSRQTSTVEHFYNKIDNAYIWDKVFKSEPSKICGGQSLKILKGYGLLYATLWVTLFCRKFNELSQNLSFGSEFVLVFEI